MRESDGRAAQIEEGAVDEVPEDSVGHHREGDPGARSAGAWARARPSAWWLALSVHAALYETKGGAEVAPEQHVGKEFVLLDVHIMTTPTLVGASAAPWQGGCVLTCSRRC